MAQLINVLICLLASLTLVVAPPPRTDYDVIIVGGGPAGLSAQSALCRVSRTSVLFDHAQYRNADTRHMHDVIGNDGTAPNDFRAAAREQIAKYTTGLYKTTKVEAIFYQNLEGYRIFYAIDSTGAQYTARRVILATGVKDDLPTYLQGEDLFGKGIFWCPWCDGFEHRGQPLAILGKLSSIVGDILEMKNINPDIVLLASGSDTDDERTALDQKLPGWRELLQNAGVEVYSERVTGVRRLDDGRYDDLPQQCRTPNDQAPILDPDPDLPDPSFPDPKELTGRPCTPFGKDAGPNGRHYDRFEITFDGRASIIKSAILIETLKHQRSTLPSQLALNVNENDRVVISMDKVMSSVAGVHAAGDMTNEGATNVPWAMYSGKKAAVVAHVAIAKEDAYDGNVPPPGAAVPPPGAAVPPPALLKRGAEGEITERDAMVQAGNHMEKLWRRIELSSAQKVSFRSDSVDRDSS